MEIATVIRLQGVYKSVFWLTRRPAWRAARTVMCAAFMLQASLAHPAPWLDASIFDVSESQLTLTIPDVQKVDKPPTRAGGLRGLWKSPPTTVAGHAFETIFYFRDSKVQRVEQTWHADGLPCLAPAVYDDVVVSLDEQLNTAERNDESVSRVRARKSAVWSGLDVDFAAFLIVSNMRCVVRLVKTPRVLKDASSL